MSIDNLPTPDTESNNPIDIVAIGASAGGLDPLQRWFHELPDDTGAAYVVIQHLSPDYKSIMDQLLGRCTGMPLLVVDKPRLIKRNSIYMLSPGTEIVLDGQYIVPTERKANNRIHLPINTFFRSLANQTLFRPIAVIFSGTGSDGGLGIKAIHETGGLVFVQSPEDSQFNGMPMNAIATGVANKVATVEQLSKTLINYLRYRGVPTELLRNQETHENKLLKEIYKTLHQDTKIDFSIYKFSTFTRRLENRMSISQAYNLEKYLLLLSDPETGELERLKQDLFIGVTEFFRDHEAFEHLRKEVIAPLITNKKANEPIRIWSIGCSSGEEAYSLAILFQEEMDQQQKFHEVKIFATDADSRSLEKAMQGVYPESIANEMSEQLLSTHFINDIPGLLRVRKHIRNMVVFAQHNALQDPPFSNSDLVTCRNMLIYFKTAGQEKILNSISFSLRPGGHLFLGKAETPATSDDAFECLDYTSKIYRKSQNTQHKLLQGRLQVKQREANEVIPAATDTFLSNYNKYKDKSSFLLHVANTIFDYYLPPTIIVDNKQKLYHSYGDLTLWMQRLQPGRTENMIHDLFLPSVSSFLMSAIHQAAEGHAEVIYEELQHEKSTDQYSIRVLPLSSMSPIEQGHNYFIIGFFNTSHINLANQVTSDDTDFVQKTSTIDEASQHRLSYLEGEVQDLRTRLKLSEQQLNSTNEQLQTSNEELMASNEELQGTNEELQAVNEELYTLNSEHQHKITELSIANNDLDNFMKSTGIAAIFLDRNYAIRRYTASFSRYFNILPIDINRSFLDLKQPFKLDNLEAILKQCVTEALTSTHKIELANGSTAYLLIRPYQDVNNETHGIVLMINEISEMSELRHQIDELVLQNQQLQKISSVLTWDYQPVTKELKLKNIPAELGINPTSVNNIEQLYAFMTVAERHQFEDAFEHLLIQGGKQTITHQWHVANHVLNAKTYMVYPTKQSSDSKKLFGFTQIITVS